MREIKFRAYLKESKEFVYGVPDFSSQRATGIVWMHTIQGEEVGIVKDTIGQFTGLHDKNGKEIWEGDILGVPNPNRRYVVKFGNFENGLAYDSWQGGTGFYVHNQNEGDEGIGLLWDTSDFKVLGNIYENPELLGEQK